MTGMYNVLEKLREIDAAQRAGSVSARSETLTGTRKAPGADASGSGDAHTASGGRESIVDRRDRPAGADSRQTHRPVVVLAGGVAQTLL